MSNQEDAQQNDADQSSAVLLPAERVERSDAVPMLNCDVEDDGVNRKAEGFLKITRKYVPTVKLQKPTCSSVRRFFLLIVGCLLVGLSLILMVTGTIRFHQCQRHKTTSVWYNGILGSHSKELVALNNFALEKPVYQSSTKEKGDNGVAVLAVDGDLETCSSTDFEISPVWQVDLGIIRPIKDIMIYGSPKIHFKNLRISVGNTNSSDSRSNCFYHEGSLTSHLLITRCQHDVSGRFITVALSSSSNIPDMQLILCEVVVTQR